MGANLAIVVGVAVVSAAILVGYIVRTAGAVALVELGRAVALVIQAWRR